MHTRAIVGFGLGRLIGSVVLVLGIALMHHIVVTACAPATSAVDHHHAAVATAPMTSSAEGVSDLPPQAPDAAGACLAVAVSGWLLVPLTRGWRLRCNAVTSGRAPDPEESGAPPRPPDLTVLSVRRT